MNALFCNIRPDAPTAEKVVGVVVGKGFSDREKILKTLLPAPQDVLFVWVEPRRPLTRDGVTKHDMEIEIRDQLPQDSLILPLNPYWKHARGDFRRSMADCELSNYCSQVMVFDDNGDRCKFWKGQAQWLKKVKLISPTVPGIPPTKSRPSGKGRTGSSSS